MIEQPFQKTVENIQLPAPENKKPSNNYDEVETIGPTGEKVARRRFKPEALAGQPKEATVEERGPQGFKIFDRRNPASIAIDKEIKEKGVLVPEQKTAAPPETTPETTPETSNVMGAALEEQESRYSPDEKKEIGWEQKKESEVLLEDLNWTRSYHYMNAELILRQSRKTGRLLARVRERIFGPKQASQTDNSKEDIFVDSYKKPSAEINQEEKFRRNFVQAKLEYQKLLDKYTRAVLKEKKDELADEPDEKKKEGLLAEIKKDIFLAEEQRFVEASQNLLSVVDQERFGKWKAKIIEEPNNNIFEKLFDKASSYFGGNEPRAQASEREKTMMSSVDELLTKESAVREKFAKVINRFGPSLEILDIDSWKVKQYLKDLSLLPENLTEFMKTKGVGIKIGNKNMISLTGDEELRLSMPRGHTESWEKMDGCYVSNSRKKTVYAGNAFAAMGDDIFDKNAQTTVSVVLHEYGHGIDGTFRLFASADVNTAHKRLYNKLDYYLQQGGPGARAGMEEFVAESFSDFFKKSKEVFVKRYDEDWYSFWDKTINNLEVVPLPPPFVAG